MKECKNPKKCGGCVYRMVSYREQLDKKQKEVSRLLGKYGRVAKIQGMEEPYYYRNKVHGVVAQGKNKRLYSGIYQAGTHNVIPVKKCMLENELAAAMIEAIVDFANAFHIPAYDEDRHTGLLRHILVRAAVATGEYLVVLVMSRNRFPAEREFVEALTLTYPQIKSIVISVNAEDTTFVLGKTQRVLYGDGTVTDRLLGMNFRISATAFYQVNHQQTEKLYRAALQIAGICKSDIVLDAYCGIGTIGLLAARQAKYVFGVELNQKAVEDAIFNAKINHAENIRFIHQDAGKFMQKLAKEHQKIQVVIVDPPRSGLSREFLFSLCQLKPERVVYISCNPQTQERDLSCMLQKGYRVLQILPFDLFPFTTHVETVCLLTRKAQ